MALVIFSGYRLKHIFLFWMCSDFTSDHGDIHFCTLLNRLFLINFRLCIFLSSLFFVYPHVRYVISIEISAMNKELALSFNDALTVEFVAAELNIKKCFSLLIKKLRVKIFPLK